MLRSLVTLVLALCATAPAAAQDDFAHFDVYADGDAVHLLTGHGKKGGPAIALYHRVSRDGGATWSAPRRVNPPDRERLSAHHPGENPQVAAAGNRVVVAWTEPRPNARRGGLIATMISDDGGATWKPGPVPFQDAAGSQTFMRMVAAGRTLHMTWLDSRDGRQGLRYARSADAGNTWSADVAVAPRTCDCCWNSIAANGAEVSLLFRGGEPRDMMHAASRDGTAWSKAVSVDNFNWRVNACPHVGGALAVRAGALHALSWTGKEERQGLHHVSLGASGWSMPRRLGGDDARNADLAVAADGTLVAIWDEAGARTSPLRMARSKDGVAWSAPEIVAARRDATHPRVVATPRGVVALGFEGQPWSAARVVANGRPVDAPAR
ncbi:MAG: exo-alpha-sialidase [Burkholderiales bacterium]|nr:exo-alpha-sialidase [Burkholderiales bacterium]